MCSALNNGASSLPGRVDVVISPTFLHIDSVMDQLNRPFMVAAQDCSQTSQGAYTGDVAADQLRDIGLKWVVLGHSERRKYHANTNQVVATKTVQALKAGLKVILCIGELLEDRKAGRTLNVVFEQLNAVAAAISVKDWQNIVIAYEPVWAIGTGAVASPEQAQEVHAQIRVWLEKMVSRDAALTTRIIYGGSVKPKNCVSLIKQRDIDGFLVGGAAKSASKLLSIIQCTELKKTLNAKL